MASKSKKAKDKAKASAKSSGASTYSSGGKTYNTQTGNIVSKSSSSSSTKSTTTSKSGTAPTVNYNYDPGKESASEYNARIEKERKAVNDYSAEETKTEADKIRTEPTPQETAELQAILNNPSLTDDMRAAIQSIYGATVEGDAAKAAKVVAAMQAASEFSDPYFKAQIRLATDALKRGIEGKDGDLAFAEKEKQAALDELRANTRASKELLSFEHSRELQQLATKYEIDLEDTRQNLAATGFTGSSRRARSEQILGEQNTGLVESSTKQFGYKTGNLDRSLNAADESTQAQIENLRRMTQEGKLDLYRSAEQTVGTVNLPNINGLDAVGGVGGTIPRQQVTDATSFANNFVF